MPQKAQCAKLFPEYRNDFYNLQVCVENPDINVTNTFSDCERTKYVRTGTKRIEYNFKKIEKLLTLAFSLLQKSTI